VDRYGTDVLAAGRRKPRSTEHPAQLGMMVEDVETGFVGAVVRVEYCRVDLEDRHGRTRGFALGPGYLLARRTGRPPAAVVRSAIAGQPRPVSTANRRAANARGINARHTNGA
jgi:hypothetical protein